MHADQLQVPKQRRNSFSLFDAILMFFQELKIGLWFMVSADSKSEVQPAVHAIADIPINLRGGDPSQIET